MRHSRQPAEAEVILNAARSDHAFLMKLPTGHGFDVTARIQFTTTPLQPRARRTADRRRPSLALQILRMASHGAEITHAKASE